MWKKMLFLVACSGLMASLLMGCGKDNKELADAEKENTASGVREVTAVRPIPDDLKFTGEDTLENNVWTRLYESELDIKLKYEWMSPIAQYDQKLNISIASDKLPDMFQVSAVQLKQLVEDERILDLTQVYEENASDYTKEVLSQDGGNALLSATFGEKLMAIPKMASGLGNTNVLWIRTDWLEKVGLEAPGTIDDVVEIAKQFTENDPDGNGKNDTFGFGLNKDLWGMFASLEGFMNGFGAYPNHWIEADGSLSNGNVQPEMKLALQKVQEMFQLGYIDPEFGVKDSFKVSADVGEGKIGMFYGLFWNMGWLSDAKIANPEMEWKAYSIVGTEEGNMLAQVPFPVNTYYVINKDAKHSEAMIEMLNLQLEKCFGTAAEPEVYNVDKQGNPIFEYPFIYSEPPMKNPDAQTKVSEALGNKDVSKLSAEEKGYYDNIMQYRAGDMKGWGAEMMYGPESSLAVINEYAKNNKVCNNGYFGPPTDAMTQSEATLVQTQLQVFTNIIMGGDIEQFDKYASDWMKLGGEKITEEVNQWKSER